MNAGLTKNFIAGAAIPARTIVKFGADSRTVLPAAAATDNIIGVSTDVDAAIGDPCDVLLDDIGLVKAGGAITRGGLVTSDVNGNAVAAAPAVGVNNRTLGVAMEDAVLNDVFNVYLAQHSVQG